MSRRVRPAAAAVFPIAILACVVAAATIPLVTGRYTFFLDQVMGPGWNALDRRVVGFRSPAYGGSLPIFLLLDSIATLWGVGVAQDVLWVGVLSLTASIGYGFLPGSRYARLYGALLLLVNPFVYQRVLVGHWAIVWGVAMLPLVCWAYTAYLDSHTPRRLLLAVGSISALGVTAHVLSAGTILLGSLTTVRYLDDRNGGVLRRALAVGLLALPVSAYWLVPALLETRGAVSAATASDLATYAPPGDAVASLVATATMRGFWRGGTVTASDRVPAVAMLFGAIVVLAVYGFLAFHDDERRGPVVRAVALTGLLAILLGAGVSGPAAGVFRWAAQNLPLVAGMRDSNKFVALVVFASAYLGSLGVTRLLAHCRALDHERLVRAGLLVLVVVTPLAATVPMVTGYAGQVSSQDYPASWYEVEQVLAEDPGTSQVLFLPWHQYMDYDWLDGSNQRIATPARAFFSRPIVQGDNAEVGGTYSTSTNPVSEYVERLFGLGPGNGRPVEDDLGARLARINVEYVLVTKEVDWRFYDDVLADQQDLTMVFENEDFRVYRNDRRVHRAYGTDQLPVVGAQSHRRGDDESALQPASGQTTLTVERRSPARYSVQASDRTFTVLTLPQTASGPGWRIDGARPTGYDLDAYPVIASAGDPVEVRYGPFYRQFLPSYLLSVAAGAVLLLYGITGGTAGRDAARFLRQTVNARQQDD